MSDAAPMGVVWPLFDLRLRTRRLELRVPRGEDLEALAALAGAGIHDPAAMPFSNEWTDVPPLERQRAVLQWQWKVRSTLRPADWFLSFAVIADGVVAGVQDIIATDFSTRREVSTGSWLGMAHQGRGLGKEMRSVILEFAFAHLHAEQAVTSALSDNVASNAITRAMGYAPDGVERPVVRGEAVLLQRYRLSREVWLAGARPRVRVEGLEPCLPMLGAQVAGTG